MVAADPRDRQRHQLLRHADDHDRRRAGQRHDDLGHQDLQDGLHRVQSRRRRGPQRAHVRSACWPSSRSTGLRMPGWASGRRKRHDGRRRASDRRVRRSARPALLASSLLRTIGRYAARLRLRARLRAVQHLAAALGRHHGAQDSGRGLCLSADLDPETASPSSNFIAVFHNSSLIRAFFNTLLIASATTVVALIVGVLGGYGFSRYRIPGGTPCCGRFF